MALCHTSKNLEDGYSILKENTAFEDKKDFGDFYPPRADSFPTPPPGGPPGEAMGGPSGAGASPGSGWREWDQASLDRIEIFKKAQHDPNFSKCPQPDGFFWRTDGTQTVIIPKPCNRYDCPHCGKVRANQIRDKIREGCRDIEGDLEKPHSQRIIRFLTLTQETTDYQPITAAYNRFKVYLALSGYSRIRYFWIKEFTKKGKPHLHILMNRYIPQAILSECWRQATYGKSYIVHVTRVNFTIRNPAGYVTKYLSKAIHQKNFKKGEHRFGNDRETNWKAYSTWTPACPGAWSFTYVRPPIRIRTPMKERPPEGMESGPP